ncbi:hypothetical protein Salat_1361600 [Sesamum alatum]|uniref:Uncharacterized protein n=1 Tax=Sesamum alatum TaxID=300844 RepID=A0AAE2CQM9_9LAMI|nr:hypothetical protein Salat_1361600 [Sesamum alatum]
MHGFSANPQICLDSPSDLRFWWFCSCHQVMETNCGSVNLTTIKRSLLVCAGGEAALAAWLVSALVKAQLAVFTQEYIELFTNQLKLRGDHHTCCPCEAVDADDEAANEDEDEEDIEADDKDRNKSGNKNGSIKGVEENGGDEDDEEEDPNSEDEDDDEDDDGGDEDGDEEDDDDDDEGEEENEEEEEEEEEEALQPPKKRKK